MLPGKSRPKIRRLSRSHHSAFIHQHLTPTLNPHPLSIHLLVCPSIHSLCPFIHLPLHVISIHHTESVHPSIQYPPIHQSYPFNIHSCLSTHPTIQLSFSLSICSNVYLFHPSIHSEYRSILPFIHCLSIHLFIIYPLK